MKFSKMVTINIGGYESIKLGVDDAPSYDDCDKAIIVELERLGLSVSAKIKQCLLWQEE